MYLESMCISKVPLACKATDLQVADKPFGRSMEEAPTGGKKCEFVSFLFGTGNGYLFVIASTLASGSVSTERFMT